MRMERPTCKTCPYWDDDDETGRCRRFPAVLPTSSYVAIDIKDGGSGHAFDGAWPSTESAAWCGEHPNFPAYAANLKRNRNRETNSDLPSISKILDSGSGQSIRAKKALAYLNCETTSDVLELSKEDIVELPGIGVSTAYFIEERLAEFGLKLALRDGDLAESAMSAKYHPNITPTPSPAPAPPAPSGSRSPAS